MSGDMVSVVRQGDRRASLEALRDRIAAAIDVAADGRELAVLSLRLERILEELGSAPSSVGKGSLQDALAARRQAKEAASG